MHLSALRQRIPGLFSFSFCERIEMKKLYLIKPSIYIYILADDQICARDGCSAKLPGKRES